ncbi:hypothetical protein [Micromonospora sp. NPDC049282]|uniref:hypothetical protein n=1 Tax=Micromonospora sp. NPDC049282 TaxID=3364269 RepID=UPI00371670FA
MALMSLDPTGAGRRRRRWSMRWKAPLNARLAGVLKAFAYPARLRLLSLIRSALRAASTPPNACRPAAVAVDQPVLSGKLPENH